MPPALQKFLVIFLLFMGEALSIYAEMIGAKNNQVGNQHFLPIFSKMFLIIAMAGGFLISGYMLGIHAFKNIWVIGVISITSIIIIEPILAWSIFHQVPTPGAIIGFILGFIGLMASLFF